MRSLTLIYVVLILLGSCVQAAQNNGDNIGSQENVDRISSRESAAFHRYDTEFLNCGHTFLDPINQEQAAVGPARAQLLSKLGISADANTKEFTEQLDNALNQLNKWSPEQLQELNKQFDEVRRREPSAAWTDKQLTALDKCDVEAAARLKTQLWGNIVDVNSSHAQTPPEWSKISSQNYNAITRYRSEAEACSHRYMDPVGKAMAEGPQPKKAGDEAFNWQGQILEEALGKIEKCQIEAAASLKAQLWSP